MKTKSEYEQFCKDAENMKVYDGRGTYDLYECKKEHNPAHYPGIPQNVLDEMPKGCGNKIITTYADKGVTPFTMVCPKCGKTMTHTEIYRGVADGVKVLKWYRPDYDEYVKLPKHIKEHIDNGGLILEDINRR